MHKTQLRVRNYEVDWQGIVHNANYLLYFEVGRMEYLKNLGVKVDLNTIQKDSKVVLIRNEIDFKSPARFDEPLNIYTRISYIRNTSFAFEGFIEDSVTRRLIAQNLAIHVWIDPHTNEPIPVNGSFRKIVQQFEGDSVTILDSALLP